MSYIGITIGNPPSRSFSLEEFSGDDYTEDVRRADRNYHDLPMIEESGQSDDQLSHADHNQDEVGGNLDHSGKGSSNTRKKICNEQSIISQKQKDDKCSNHDISQPSKSSSHLISSIVKKLINSKSSNDSSSIKVGSNQSFVESEEAHNSIEMVTRMVLPEKLTIQLSTKLSIFSHRSANIKQKKIGGSTRSATDAKFVLATLEQYPSAARQFALTYHIGANIIFYQSVACVIGFWMVWLLPTISRFIQYKSNHKIFCLMFFQALFEPLQGFFNVMIYRLSHFLRLKQLHPRWTRRKLLQHTFLFTFQSNQIEGHIDALVAANDTT